MTWQTMDTAPRDGTIIQIKNDWGAGYGIEFYRWASTKFIWCYERTGNGPVIPAGVQQIECEPCWTSCERVGYSYGADAESQLRWRMPIREGS